jgi:predicted nucleic acid-binding protein
MSASFLLDTPFLVDLEGEAHTGDPGPAHWFLAENRESELCITLATAGELACGPQRDEKKAWEALISQFRLVEPDLDSSWAYGQISQYLRANDLGIGENDLSVAAVAVVQGLTLVTRTVGDFKRVPGLKVLAYGD